MFNEALPKHKKDVSDTIADVLLAMRRELVEPIMYKNLCVIDCYGCPKKVFEFLETFILDWEESLKGGYRPNFGDLSKILRIANNVKVVLQKNQLI